MIDKNISMLVSLRDEYKTIWLKYYKDNNLNLIDDKFNRLISYFKETKDAVIKDNLQPPEIKSEWIYLKKEHRRVCCKSIFQKRI